MRQLIATVSLCVCVVAASSTPSIGAESSRVEAEKIVVVRHGEKPPKGLGLLTCQGLNRALLLPDFFAKNFPKPDYIFAPDPKIKATEIHGDGLRYDYVRPLLTIGPTAIRFGVPINTQLPYNDPGLLADTLLAPEYRSATIYVAWEHLNIVEFAEILRARFRNASPVPAWDNDDYDKVFVFAVRWSTPPTLALEIRSEGLGTISADCAAAPVR